MYIYICIYIYVYVYIYVCVMWIEPQPRNILETSLLDTFALFADEPMNPHGVEHSIDPYIHGLNRHSLLKHPYLLFHSAYFGYWLKNVKPGL